MGADPRAPIDPAFADQIRALYDHLATRNLSNVIVAGLLVPPLLRSHRAAFLAAWFLTSVIVHVARVVFLQRARSRARGDEDAPALARTFTVWLLVVSVFWGASAVVLVAPRDPETQAFLVLAIGGLCAGGISANAYHLPALRARLVLVLGPFAARVLSLGDPYHLYVGLGTVLLLGYLLMYGRESWETSRRIFALRHENVELLAKLEIEHADAIRSREEAERANRAKSRLFAAASHDLSQPLQALALWAEVLADRDRVQSDEEIARHITASVESLRELFEGVLELTRLDAGRLELRPTVFPARRIVDQVALTFEGGARAKGLTLRPYAGRAFVDADPLVVQRIVNNLVSNAVRYTARGRVVVGVRTTDDSVRFLVADTGPGIPDEHLPRLFDEFVRLPGSNVHGFGLGLATVRRLAEVAGHRLEVDSRPGRGSCFSVIVPRANRPAEAESGAVADDSDASHAGMRVLLVEDDEAARRAFAAILRGWGMDCVDVGTADEAVAAFRAETRRWDVVVSDQDLPDGCKGLALIASLRALTPDPLPAVLVSGAMADELAARAREASCVPLAKPVTPLRLRSTLLQLAREFVARS